MNHLLVLMSAIALATMPARADLVLSIVPVTATLNPGDSGDLFDVILTNNGTAFTADSFSFEVSTIDTDITFQSASIATTAAPYIFAGNSFFGPDITGSGAGTQTLDAGDLTGDLSDLTMNPGDVFALGEVSFNIAANATPGPFVVTFGNAGENNLTNSDGITTVPDTLTPQSFTIQETAVPEPSMLIPLSGLAVWAAVVLRRRTLSVR